MGLTRTSSGLVLRDDFGSDTSANYYASDSKLLSVSGGELVANGQCIATDQDKTAICVTIETHRGANLSSSKACLLSTNNAAAASRGGYWMFFRNSTSQWELWEATPANSQTIHATSATDKPAAADVVHVYLRIFATTNDVRGWGGRSWPLQVALTVADDTYASGTLYDAMFFESSISNVAYFDCRSGYTITCTDLPADYQLQANASAAYKATAVGGTATLNVGMLEWPLTSVEVLDAANAQIFQVDTGDYADMGGGDAFVYEADAAEGVPFCYMINSRRSRT